MFPRIAKFSVDRSPFREQDGLARPGGYRRLRSRMSEREDPQYDLASLKGRKIMT
jgi:hypothetical protein